MPVQLWFWLLFFLDANGPTWRSQGELQALLQEGYQGIGSGHTACLLIFLKTPFMRYPHPIITDGKAETQKVEVTCLTDCFAVSTNIIMLHT